ncbi:hypothetical protein, variant [Blastomyces gilchristii SLH14081]|uniref:Alcohol dehydrogenase-like N-terminal domain-containing protein n=1 Tax=Blastomyces gilchristii (strain SLH14081) TaxID=559298 RepID=A0A179V0V0_BLAGS|nr:hypothetical protein, variant [Blastomyces gilchristii SLH14081]OAT12232.1 hypothetical protein, variant [Blastomyces gilchristii SLH14081]
MTAQKRRRSSIENLERAMKNIKLSPLTTGDHEIPAAYNSRVDDSSVEMQKVQRLPNPGVSLETEAEMTTTNCNLSAAEELENNKETCKAGVVVNRGENYSIEIKDVKVPEPGADEVLVKIKLFRVCSGDIHCLKGRAALVHNADNGVESAGHEGVGVVVKIGSHLKGIKLGARVGIGLLWRYNYWGTNDRSKRRESILLTGIDVPGTFQQYITLPGSSIIWIPDGVSDETAACLMCCGGPIYEALHRSGYSKGDWALIATGTIAQKILAAQIANAKGLRPTVFADHSQKDLCLKMGVKYFVAKGSDQNNKILELIGVDDQYKSYSLHAHGSKMDNHLRVDNPYGGSGVYLATQRDDDEPPPYMYNMILATIYYTNKVLRLVAKKLVTAAYKKRPFDELPKAIRDVESQQVQECVLLDFDM